jgi:hypothetical protein
MNLDHAVTIERAVPAPIELQPLDPQKEPELLIAPDELLQQYVAELLTKDFQDNLPLQRLAEQTKQFTLEHQQNREYTDKDKGFLECLYARALTSAVAQAELTAKHNATTIDGGVLEAVGKFSTSSDYSKKMFEAVIVGQKNAGSGTRGTFFKNENALIAGEALVLEWGSTKSWRASEGMYVASVEKPPVNFLTEELFDTFSLVDIFHPLKEQYRQILKAEDTTLTQKTEALTKQLAKTPFDASDAEALVRRALVMTWLHRGIEAACQFVMKMGVSPEQKVSQVSGFLRGELPTFIDNPAILQRLEKITKKVLASGQFTQEKLLAYVAAHQTLEDTVYTDLMMRLADEFEKGRESDVV